MMRVGRVFAVTVLLVATLPASAAELVREFSGSGNTTTVAFHVESPWIMDWRLDADYDQLVALDITLVEAKTGRHIGRVLHISAVCCIRRTRAMA
jgi:hypothetical protein